MKKERAIELLQDAVSDIGCSAIGDKDMDSTWDNLGLDSLDKLELVMELEDALRCCIDDDKAEQAKTPNEAVELMLKISGAL